MSSASRLASRVSTIPLSVTSPLLTAMVTSVASMRPCRVSLSQMSSRIRSSDR
jgi:hypothetical protein